MPSIDFKPDFVPTGLIIVINECTLKKNHPRFLQCCSLHYANTFICVVDRCLLLFYLKLIIFCSYQKCLYEYLSLFNIIY